MTTTPSFGGWSGFMAVVYEWSRHEILALRHALNLNAREFATALAVEERTIHRWTKPDATVVIRNRNRRKFDELLAASPLYAQARFDRLRGELRAPAQPATPVGLPATLAEDASGADGFDHVQVLARAAMDGKVVLVSLPRRAVVAGIGIGAVAAAIGKPPAARAFARSTDTDWLTHLRDVRMSVIDDDNTRGAGKAVPLMEHYIDMIGQLRRDGAADSTQLQRMRVLYAECASWLHQDACTWDNATAWTAKASQWALALKDPGCVAMVAIRSAHIACERGDGVQALDSAEAATAQAPPGSRVAAVAALFGGWGHALLRDATASARAFDTARTLAANADDDSEWGMFLDPAYVDVHQAAALGVLGRHRDAISGFATAIGSMRGGFTRDQAVYTARLALSHAAAGEGEAAAALGVAAMHTGVTTNSQRVLDPVRQLRSMIDESSSDPNIQEFAEAAQLWLSRPA